MKKFKKPQAEKAYQHFLDNPGAKPMSVAKRFKLSVPYTYKLRDQAAGRDVEERDALLSDAEFDALTTLPAHKQQETVDEILGSRAKTYGAFRDNACLAQALKRSMADHAQDLGNTFADDQWEALEMIATKVSRIVTGDPNSIDQWDDIAGYATLVADRLRGVVR
jgi:hypothetical protein